MKVIANSINDKKDFASFVRSLSQDFKNNSQEWENDSLDSFFEAMASWIEDMDGYYINEGLPISQNVNWKVFADALMAAKIYE